MKKLKIVIISAIVVLVIGMIVTVAILIFGGSGDGDIKPVNANSYFEGNGKVISVTNAKKSKNVLTEKEAVKLLSDRGFTEYSVTTEYSMDGEYNDPKDIDDSSDNKHPVYSTYYTSKTEEVWTIYIIDGSVIAYPASYNLESDKDVELIISEKDTLISYDNTTNNFYETKPKESAVDLKIIKQISSKSLDNLTKGDIDKL